MEVMLNRKHLTKIQQKRSDKMEFESIQKIVEAEQEAEKIKEEAQQKAKAILAQVEKAKENSIVYFKSQLFSKQKELEKTQEEQNAQEKAKIKADAIEKLQQIREISPEKLSQAVEKIFSKVIKL